MYICLCVSIKENFENQFKENQKCVAGSSIKYDFKIENNNKKAMYGNNIDGGCRYSLARIEKTENIITRQVKFMFVAIPSGGIGLMHV